MRCANHLILLLNGLSLTHAVSLPEATSLPQKRNLGNLAFHNNTFANTTVDHYENNSTSDNTFDIRLNSLGGTITMDVGPLSVFTQTTTSLEIPTTTGYIILPRDYNETKEIPTDGIEIVFSEQMQQDLLTAFKMYKGNDTAVIEALQEVMNKHAPDLEKRVVPVLLAGAMLLGIVTALYLYNEPQPQPVHHLHLESTMITSAAALSATHASVMIVESTPGDKNPITISMAELTSLSPYTTTSPSFNPTGLLTTDSSGHLMFQIQGTTTAAFQSAKTIMASPTASCTFAGLVERDNTEVDEEATCVANRLMDSAPGLLEPNGLISTFRTQIVEVAGPMVPDFVPIFQDVRVGVAFGLFLAAADTLIPLLFPGLAQAAWHLAGFIAFGLAMLPLASNIQGKLQSGTGITQYVTDITRGKSGSGTQAICPPQDQPYNCASIFCIGDDLDFCTGIWSEGCPCTRCPSLENTPSCNDCDPNPKGECTTEFPGCSCYFDSMQNSNFEDLAFQQLTNQISASIPSWASVNPPTNMAGVVCRPDNSWYEGCQYPNTETGFAFGANTELENCLITFFTVGTAQDVNNIPTPNPNMPADMMMGPQSSNVTVICPSNKRTVDFMINVAWAPGCVSTQNYNGQVNINDPIGDGSINGSDILRGTYYGCLNYIVSYDTGTEMVDMVPGSAGQGYKPSSQSETLFPGVSNGGLGGWNQIGCLLYEVIPTKYRPQISVNNQTGSSLKNVAWYGQNWGDYQEYWPKLPGVYYDLGAFYCPVGSYNQEWPPCSASPCYIDNYAGIINS